MAQSAIVHGRGRPGSVPCTAVRMDAVVPLCPLYRGAVEERYVILEYLHPGLLPSGHRRAFAQGAGHGRFGSGRPAGAVAFSGIFYHSREMAIPAKTMMTPRIFLLLGRSCKKMALNRKIQIKLVAVMQGSTDTGPQMSAT